jgi:hypothetical protein
MHTIFLALLTAKIYAAKLFIRPQAGSAYSIINVKNSNPDIAVDGSATLDKMAGLLLGIEGQNVAIYGDVQYELLDHNQKKDNSFQSGHSKTGINLGIGISLNLGPLYLSASYIGHSYRNAGSHVYEGSGGKLGLSIYGDNLSFNGEVSYRKYQLNYNGIDIATDASALSLYAYLGYRLL